MRKRFTWPVGLLAVGFVGVCAWLWPGAAAASQIVKLAFYQAVAANGTSQTRRNRLNLIQGANVTISAVDNSGTNSTDFTIAATGGSSGGGVVSSTWAGRSACNVAAEGVTAVFTNSAVVSYCFSSVWANSFLGRRVNLPSIAGTWLNQGTSTIDATHGYISLVTQSGNGTNVIRGQAFATPVTPYTISLTLLASGFMQNYDSCGLFLRDSVGGRVLWLTGQGREGGSGQVFSYAAQRWTTSTAFSANILQTFGQPSTWAPAVAVQIEDNGATRFYRISSDGQNWSLYTSTANTDWVTAPDQYGYGCDSQGNGNALVGLFYDLTVQ
jgi:hypothetical protein